MGKGRPRAVEKGVLGHCPYSSSSGALNIPQAPVYYPTEEEFNDPLEFIDKIRLEAESYGICRIVPPKSWKPPFALDLDSFTFPTKSQAIHRLQARTAGCDPTTFELEYNRFLDSRFGRKPKKRVIFEGGELDLCKLFNAVKRYGGYSKVVKEKKWGDVFRFLSSVRKISECSKHVLCQLYLEHLFDYEEHLSQLNDKNKLKDSKRACGDRKTEEKGSSISDVKRKGKSFQGKKIKMGKLVEKEEFDQICEQCQSGLHGEVMLLCDRCDKGWHLYCLSPPLEQVPLGNWYCLECVNSNKDSFGFVPGKRFTLEAFRRLADRAKRKWFGTMPATRSQIEKQFWEIVEGLVGEVEVKYGSDLDTSIYGSGFPRMNDPPPSSIEPAVWKKYSNSPWNLNNLPKLQGSMLRAVHGNIAGVMVPWLYVGMLFSSFCWHFEDHCFYSMNYLHWGEPKCWYSVPGSEAHSFEQVMRKTLPDLFDTQPDLLFQLVTMLNPSVLQDSGVPVYGVLQEPGNFVITFPRSFHGGFNFGLNCAEAVNFAPADWLPHGGYGADLYRFYHKAAVLSHEELLCVVSKGNCHSKVFPYLKAEMLRTFTKENKFREKIWRSGVIKSSPLSPRKHPEYVGTEEDPTCIICHQYLYLSAVVCSCRPSAFLCLEHWEHFCECKPRKHRLLYRHTLADLNDLLTTVTTALTGTCSLEKSQHQFSLPIEANIVTKEVKGGFVTFAQLAEDWLSRSCDFLKNTFSDAACISLLKEAEQFIWAGHEMDSVRNMACSLNEAQKWAEGVRNCLSRLETNLGHSKDDKKKVCLSEVDNLLRVASPCNEPTHPKLKAYAEEARILVSQIKSALSSSSQIVELEALYSKAAKLPIYLDECTRLRREISSAKAWVDRVRECLSKKKPATLEIDVLYELRTQMLGLSASVPEMELLSVMLSQVESWQTRSREFLNGPITLQDLEAFLQDVNNFTVSIPELKLLHQYRSDALSWISQLNAVIEKNQDREDHNNIVEELTCLMKKGSSLRVQVNEMSLLDAELRKSCCREKALKALSTQMTLEFIQELISEAASLQIESEKLFIDVTGVLAAAVSWEERAKHILTNCGHMSEFEEMIRTSKDIFVILPSRQDVMNALTMAESWIRASQPFLMSTVSSEHVSNSLLEVDALKELVSQSKLLKVSLKAPEVLQSILKSVEAWENESYTLLEHINSFLNMHAMDPTIENGLSMRIIELHSRVTSATKAGLSLGFHFEKMSELDGASCVLQWSLKTLSLCTSAASLKEVNSLISDADHLLAKFAHNIFVCELISGLRWVKQALMVIPEPQNHQRYKLRDVEVVLEEAKRVNISFPMMVARLVTAIEKHKSWQKQVEAFFSSRGKQSWCSLLALKKVGDSDALDTPELDKITSETEKINKWIMQCKYIVAPPPDDVGSLSHALTKIKETLDRALCIYRDPEGCRVEPFCLCCSSDAEDEGLACLMCKDRYHQSCMGPSLALEPDVKDYICPFCLRMESGIISGNGGWPLISRRKRPRLKTLVELLQDSQDFYAGVEERDLVEGVVERALTCKLYLTGTVDRVLTYTQKNLTSVSQSLLTSVKAIAIAGVYDHEDSCNLELALTRNSWKIRVKKLLEGPTKPYIQSVQQLLNEGVAVNVPSEDQYMQELREVKNISLQWASVAKKVASDYGVLELDEVFKLIKEGENLPIHLDKELKLLKARSELYCICRKPYDQRDMIACDRCDEWYHFDCINMVGPPPKTFICAACNPPETDSISIASLTDREDRSSTEEGPQTPPPRHSELKRRRLAKTKSSLQQKMRFATDLSNILRFSSETDHLWRKSQRPLSRKTRKRSKLDSLSRYPHLLQ